MKTYWDFITGLTAGTADVLTTHPIWNTKTLMQSGYTFSNINKFVLKNPLILYNGVTTSMVNAIPLTTMRVVCSNALEGTAKNYVPEVYTPYVGFVSAFVVGGVSSFLSNPLDLARTIKLKNAVYNTQNISTNFNTEISVSSIIKISIKDFGKTSIFSGVGSLATRDAIYTAGFLPGARFLKKSFNELTDYDALNSGCAYITAGILTSFINHPFDTIKTTQHFMNAESFLLSKPVQNTFWSACKKIISEKGVLGFYTGFPVRAVDHIVAFIVKATIISKMDDYYASNFHDQVEKKLVGDNNVEDS